MPPRARRFETPDPGQTTVVRPASTSPRARDTRSEASRLPVLVFVRQRRSGASRRMESLVAWVKVTQKKRLRVVEVDVDRDQALARRLEVTEVPSLLLIKERRVVGRLEGRATGRQIEELIRPHLAA